MTSMTVGNVGQTNVGQANSVHRFVAEIMREQVTAVVEGFESGKIPEALALARLRELTGREVTSEWLRNYWRSEPLKDFVDRLCATPLNGLGSMTDDHALALIAEFLETASPGRQDSIQVALERRFAKPSGTLTDLVYYKNICEPNRLLEELRKDTRIYL